MNGNIRVGNLFGIPFFINVSWFLVLGLVTLSYGSALAGQFPMGGILPWLLGFVAALLLFASVLAHELGHSFVAIKQGIEVKSITLFLFGGLASLEKESKTPAEAFWVAIAGPLVSIALFGILTAIQVTTGLTGPLGAVLGLVASINLILALFNLIPGLPLDGGNILKSIVWKVTGNPYKGVVFASRVGQIFGWIAIVSGFFGSFWNILIGLFLLQNAGRAAQSASVQDKLAGLTAEDAVLPNSPIIPATLSLRELANEYIIGNKAGWRKFFVTDEQGQLLGVLAVDDMKKIFTDQWPHTSVTELMKPMTFTTSVKPEQSLLEVVMMLEQQQLNELPVIRENGTIVGLIQKTAIISLLERKAQAKPA